MATDRCARQNQPWLSTAVAGAWVLVSVTVSLADDSAESTPDELATWREVYLEEAQAWTITRNGDSSPLKLSTQPIMYWNSDNDYNGAVYVWRSAGRPEVVGSVFSTGINRPAGERIVYHELQSISVSAVTCRHPDVGGDTFPSLLKPRVLDKAPMPAATKRGQMLQARRLSRQFTAQMTSGDEVWNLRLLPQPVDEFEVAVDPGEDVRSGAIFAMVAFVTDPELLLLLEVRETSDGPRWHYQPLRFTNRNLEVQREGEVVWISEVRGSTPTGENPDDRLYKFFGGRRVSVP